MIRILAACALALTIAMIGQAAVLAHAAPAYEVPW